MDSGSSGMLVIETPPGGEPIPVSRETVAAFIGPAPRGPVDIPVAVRSVDEFLARFGVRGHPSRLELLLRQYFGNGGSLAVVVRVTCSARRNRIVLPGRTGPLVLEALNPGSLEHLRASIDYDGIGPDDPDRFNLVIHRCASGRIPVVEEQESYRGISIRPTATHSVVEALENSGLVRLAEPLPAERPTRTAGTGDSPGSLWVECQANGQVADVPADYDLIGSREEGTGLFALDRVPAVDLLYLVPGAPGAELGPVALLAAGRYCRERQAMLVLDPPAAWASASDVIRAQRERRFASPDALTYFPALELATVGGSTLSVSAAGAIMGWLAAHDAASGPWATSAAGRTMALGNARPAVALAQWEADQINRLCVNALVRSAAGRTELHGQATLARFSGVATSWNELPRRRTALFIVGNIARYTRWAACCAAGPDTWREVCRQVTTFLGALRERGALAGATPAQSFYVKCDPEPNHAAAATADGLCFIVGFALRRPNEFVAFQFTQQTDACRVVELSWQPAMALAG